MGAYEKTLIVMAAEWGEVIAAILAPCFTVPGVLAAVGRQVEGGQALAFTADDGGEIVGAFVLRVEGDEGVVVAAAGKVDGVDLIHALLPQIESRFIGCRAIRFHTARAGLAKIMAHYGYTGQEIIMRKELQ